MCLSVRLHRAQAFSKFIFVLFRVPPGVPPRPFQSIASGVYISPGRPISAVSRAIIIGSVRRPSAGSAPDIAGQGIANPLAQILSAGMLLTYALDMTKEAAWIEAAVERVLNEGWRTRDIADENTPADHILGTAEMGNKVVAAL